MNLLHSFAGKLFLMPPTLMDYNLHSFIHFIIIYYYLFVLCVFKYILTVHSMAALHFMHVIHVHFTFS